MTGYYAIVTNKGKEKDVAARAVGGAMPLYAQLAVGDGGGAEFNPLETQVSLINEVWRGNVNRVFVHPINVNWVVIEARVPAEAGPFDIREVGVYDTDGHFVVVGSQALTVKPDPASGSTKDLYVRIICEITNAGEVIQLVDPTLVYLTEWHLAEHADRRDNPHTVTVSQIGAETPIGAQAKVDSHANRTDNPHTVTVGQIGAETPTDAQVKVDAHANRTDNPHEITAAQAGADPVGTALAGDNALRGGVSANYNTLEKIALKLNQIDAVLSSDDVTLDDVQEIITYIKDNATDITALMGSKLNVSAVVDNLLSTLTNAPLSGNQGRLLKGLIDNHGHALATALVDGLMAKGDKAKLDGIAAQANKYLHPSTHPASMITQDSLRRLVSDSEKAIWNSRGGKATIKRSTNGWWKCPDTGLIMQWGSFTKSRGSTVVFPIAFPSICYGVQTQCFYNSTTSFDGAATSSWSKTGFVHRGTYSYKHTYFAMGV